MVRVPLTPADRERGERLGRLLREARGERNIGEVAAAARISAETLRKIETGRIPTPAFFTVSALARTLGLSLDELGSACAHPPTAPSTGTRPDQKSAYGPRRDDEAATEASIRIAARSVQAHQTGSDDHERPTAGEHR